MKNTLHEMLNWNMDKVMKEFTRRGCETRYQVPRDKYEAVKLLIEWDAYLAGRADVKNGRDCPRIHGLEIKEPIPEPERQKPAPEYRKYIATRDGDCESYHIQLTEEQIRLLDWLINTDYLDSDVSIDELSNADFETI